MIQTIEILNVGVSDVDLKRWKKSGRAINRIHIPLKGRCAYDGVNKEILLSEGSMYLITNSYTNDLRKLPNTPYYHFFVDFTCAPLISGKGVTQISSVEDPVVDHLLRAACGIVEEHIKVSGELRVSRDSAKLYENVKQLVGIALERLVKKHGLIKVTDEKLELAFAYIASNYSKKLRNEDIARAVGADTRTLARMFSKYVDMSPYQYLIQCRIEHSVEDLKQGRSIASVARRCGFSSENAFRITFKKVMGYSPSGIKKRISR